jgi:phosphoglycolate phosphatase
MQQTFRSFGAPLPERSAIIGTMGMGLDDAIHFLGGPGIDDVELAVWVAHYRRIYNGERTVLFSGVSSFLNDAQIAGVSSVIVTNKGERATRKALLSLGILPAIAELFCGDTTSFRKPDPRLYWEEIRLRYPTVSSDEVLVIGDTATDLRFARASGLRCCWASYGYGLPHECSVLQPDSCLATFDQLRSIVFSNT